MAIAAVFGRHNELVTEMMNNQAVKSYKAKIRQDFLKVEKALTDPEFYIKKIMRVVKKHAENMDLEEFKIHTFNAATGRILGTAQIANLKSELSDEYKIVWRFERTGNDEAGTLYARFMTAEEIAAELAEIKAEVEAEEKKAEVKAEVKA